MKHKTHPVLIASSGLLLLASVGQAASFAKGADIGWLQQMEATGYVFHDRDGKPEDCLKILKDHGLDTIRLRVWVNPSQNPRSGHCSRDEVAAMAERATRMGFRIMIDFHYSDSWADPGKQRKPAAWVAHDFDQLTQDVFDHTTDVLTALKARGVTPEWVQIGNELRDGMLWPDGRVGEDGKNLTALLNAGYRAVKAIDPDIKVIVHMDRGNDSRLYRWFFDILAANGAQYDVIGMSYYPYWLEDKKDYTETIDDLGTNLIDMAARYQKEVMVVEIGGEDTKVENTRAMLAAVIQKVRAVPDGKGLGVVYWEPQGAASWSRYRLSCWGADGRPTGALEAFLEKPVHAASMYPERLEDPGAVYLSADRFPVQGDGLADDAAALQQAIDQVAEGNQAGVLWVPEGRYRLGKTVYVWPGVRVIGYGARRPVFLLGENTPGFQEGEHKYMLYFSGGRARGGEGPPRDGGAGTFYSALSNIDIEIGPGNPAAVGVRFHVAQHCFLSHMEFRLGSAKAGLEDIGNVVEDLHFRGGQYGILTRRSAPGWPILIMDCTFTGQGRAAIYCDEAGLTVIRPRFQDVPTAVEMAPGKPDQLWVSDALLADISGPAFIVSREGNARTEVNLMNLACRNVGVLARLREGGEDIPGLGPSYRVAHFSRGLHLGDMGETRELRTSLSAQPLAAMPPPFPSDIPQPPPPASWVSVKELGAIGDGETDDTDALRMAIAQHRSLYFPLGVYRVSDTLRLRPDSVLIGLHPGATVIYLPDETPSFQDAGRPKPVLEAPAGGSNIVSGIGVYTRARNPAAVAVKWMAGANSLLDDVRLHGGHGTQLPGGIGDDRGRADRDRWDSQHPSLWVTAGGGGVLKDIWTPSPYARAGLLISDTATRGRVYAMSVEHHVSHEVIVRNASNWQFYALQFEEEREEGPRALPLLIEDSSDLQFANTFFYRVVSSYVPSPSAVHISGSRDIRFRNTHIYSNSKVSFDSAVEDASSSRQVRDPEFAVLDVRGPAAAGPGVAAPDPRVEKLADGFLNISGAAVDQRGNVYFADPRNLTIYRWADEEHRVERVREVPQRPEQLAFDRAGNLLVIAYEGKGTVLAFDPRDPASELITLPAQPAAARPGLTPVLPVNRWNGIETFRQVSLLPKPWHFVSPDESTFIPAGEDFLSGAIQWGVKLTDLLRAFQVAPARPGKRFYVTNEAELRTWSFQVEPDGSLSDPQLFVEEGGEGVTVDTKGRVYIAAGNLRVFDPDGHLVEVIETPQRPTSLVFGGTDRRNLFFTARSALYRVRIR